MRRRGGRLKITTGGYARHKCTIESKTWTRGFVEFAKAGRHFAPSCCQRWFGGQTIVKSGAGPKLGTQEAQRRAVSKPQQPVTLDKFGWQSAGKTE